MARARPNRRPQPLAAEDGIPAPAAARQHDGRGVLAQVPHSGQAWPAGVQGFREPFVAPGRLSEVGPKRKLRMGTKFSF